MVLKCIDELRQYRSELQVLLAHEEETEDEEMASKKAADAPRGKTTFRCSPEDLKVITDSKHPVYDPRVELPLSEGLVTSIMALGFKSIIQVWKDGDNFYVIDGIQRWKAAVEANKRLKKMGKEPIEVTFVVERASEDDVFGVATALNENRQDDDPVEKAKKAKRLLDMGKSEEYVQSIFGWDPPRYRAYMSLLDAAKPVRDAVSKGQISVSAVAQLAQLPREEQEKSLAELLATGKATVERARKIVKNKKHKPTTWRSRSEVKKIGERMTGVELKGQSVIFAQFVSWLMGDLDTKDLIREFPGLKTYLVEESKA